MTNEEEDDMTSIFEFDKKRKKDKSNPQAVFKAKLNNEALVGQFGDQFNLLDIDTRISDEEFVKIAIQRAKKLFQKEAG